jgi:anti-sigma regulatory factor (Ser/Thr protein kinase)
MTATRVRPAVRLSVQPTVARRELIDMLADRGWTGDVDGAVLALHEALVNAERHAGGACRATAGLDGRALVLEVRDEGPGFSLPDEADEPERTAERGRGLWLIRQLADACEVQRRRAGVALRLRFEQ